MSYLAYLEGVVQNLQFQLTEANQKLAEARASKERLVGILNQAIDYYPFLTEEDSAFIKQSLSESPSLNEVKAKVLEEVASGMNTEDYDFISYWTIRNFLTDAAQQLRETKT